MYQINGKSAKSECEICQNTRSKVRTMYKCYNVKYECVVQWQVGRRRRVTILRRTRRSSLSSLSPQTNLQDDQMVA